MHILFITDNFPPEVNAPASRTHEHCRLWVKAGHRVTVITGVPNFPQGKVFDGYRNKLWQQEIIDGIQVIRVWTFIAANEGFLKRTFDYVSFMMSSAIAGLFVMRADVVVGTSPQFFTACSAWFLSVVKKVPFIFELRDLWPESIKAVGAMQDSFPIRMLERLELFLYKRAALIVSVTNSFKRNLAARGIDASKIVVITNGVDLSRFSHRGKDVELERALGLNGKFVAGYIGTHGMAHGLETILLAAEQLSSRELGDRFRLILLGDGAQKATLQKIAKERRLHNVLFVDTVAKSEVTRYWSLLDAAIIHLKRTELFTTVIPSKLFECMGMGIPVLHGVAGESSEIVEREAVGIVFEPENSKQLAESLVRLEQADELRAELRRNCICAAQRYDRATLASAMLDSISTTVRRPDRSRVT